MVVIKIHLPSPLIESYRYPGERKTSWFLTNQAMRWFDTSVHSDWHYYPEIKVNKEYVNLWDPVFDFHFESAKEALLFKMAWGGVQA